MDLESAKEKEIQAAFQSLLDTPEAERKTMMVTPAGLLSSQKYPIFEMFSSIHADHFHDVEWPCYRRKTLDSNSHHSMRGYDDGKRVSEDEGDDEEVYGQIHFNEGSSSTFGPFFPPKYANPDVIVVKGWDGGYEVSLRFLGNSYVMVRVPWAVVFSKYHKCGRTCPPIPSLTPEVIDFVGVWDDPRVTKEEMEKKKAAEGARRSPSPRDTFFDRCHDHNLRGWDGY